MTERYEDPWSKSLPYGAWRPAYDVEAEPCHYGCGKPATLVEPGRRWKAHKTCAQQNPSEGPLGTWKDEPHPSAGDSPVTVGCGTAPRGASGRWCGGRGDRPSCMLCPQSPSYWNPAGPVEFFGHVEGDQWEPPAVAARPEPPPVVRRSLRVDREQALLHKRWPEGAPYRYRTGAGAYGDQYAELLAMATAETAPDDGPTLVPGDSPPVPETRWACVYCRSNGRADNPAHAVALTNAHWGWVCPATATVYDDQPPPFIDKLGRLHFADGPGDGYIQRVARHQNMHRLYPHRVPEWMGVFRGRQV
jgi:hypothetical protein